MKRLLIDIETAPHLSHVWGLWQQNVGLPQIIEAGYTLCFSAQWVGEKRMMFFSIQGQKTPISMLEAAHQLLDEADIVIHYNGSKFDIPTLNKEFIENGFTPPSPYKQVDLLKVVRDQFRFPSNKLAYVAKALGLTRKVETIGHELWKRCMLDDLEAWEMMEEYNVGDIYTLEELYIKLLPWIKNHPNYGLYQEDKAVCPTCGGKHYHRRGTAVTRMGIYERYQCQDCGTWFRGTKNRNTEGRKHMLVAGT